MLLDKRLMLFSNWSLMFSQVLAILWFSCSQVWQLLCCFLFLLHEQLSQVLAVGSLSPHSPLGSEVHLVTSICCRVVHGYFPLQLLYWFLCGDSERLKSYAVLIIIFPEYL